MQISAISLAITRIVRVGASFSPLSLFAASEQGAWFDPSDLSTMFQDSAGTTPVTAAGQPVGLILDKSKGLALGPETVSTPYEIANPGWSASGTSYVRVLTGSAATGTPSNIAQPVAGKTYRVTFTASGLSGATCYLNFGAAIGFSAAAGRISTAKSYSFTLTTTTTASLSFVPYEGSDFAVTISNVSVKEIAGNHASQATAAKRPLLAATGISKWSDYDAVDDVLNTTFPSSLGSSCTVAKAVVGGSPTIFTGQTIGTTWAESTDNAGVVIVNRALTTQETTDLTAWLTAKGAT